MTPQLLLTILLAVTLVALLVDGLARGRRRDAIRRLAAAWRLNFAAFDTLQLAQRVAALFPVPGVSALRVSNLIYGLDGDTYRYFFTVEYTIGVTEGKRRVARAATLIEPRDRRRGGLSTLTLADEFRPLLDQYQSLAATGPGGQSPEPGPAMAATSEPASSAGMP